MYYLAGGGWHVVCDGLVRRSEGGVPPTPWSNLGTLLDFTLTFLLLYVPGRNAVLFLEHHHPASVNKQVSGILQLDESRRRTSSIHANRHGAPLSFGRRGSFYN